MIFALSTKDLKSLLSKHWHKPFVFLESALLDSENKRSFFFSDFVDSLTFYGQDLEGFFKRIEGYLKKGLWAVGYFNYEFGYYLEPTLFPLRGCGSPALAWLGIAKKPFVFSGKNYLTFPSCLERYSFKIKNLHPNLSLKEYLRNIQRIKRYLREGLTYQINYTFKVKFNFSGDLIDFYLYLRQHQPTAYLAFIHNQDLDILSFSPELFFRIKEDRIIARPMKGTIRRGLTYQEDKLLKNGLSNDKKSRAENLMIVDLLRNDLGRISSCVRVNKLFSVEQYRSLNQMTSTIQARLKKSLSLKDIFVSLFPCGSVTGAPKIKTMELIAGLEKEPRNIYTGAIGYFSPKGEACFNVAIRTFSFKEKRAELGIGGGIVYDSIGKREYAEALLKAKFFLKGPKNFFLFESILWDGGYFLLKEHLQRLKDSSWHFCIPLDLERLRKELFLLDKKLQKEAGGEKFKVKVLLDLGGAFKIEKGVLEELIPPVKVKISKRRIDPENVFLYHKTTHRPLYERERKRAIQEGFFEVVFFNIYGELTEGSISNVFLLKRGMLYTPKTTCGLLAGVLRNFLLKKKRAKEVTLYLNDLKQAEKVFIGNSVRGLLEAEI